MLFPATRGNYIKKIKKNNTSYFSPILEYIKKISALVNKKNIFHISTTILLYKKNMCRIYQIISNSALKGKNDRGNYVIYVRRLYISLLEY